MDFHIQKIYICHCDYKIKPTESYIKLLKLFIVKAL